MVKLFVRDHGLDRRHRGAVSISGMAQLALPLGGHFSQDVTPVHVGAFHLTGGGNREAFFRRTMGFDLRHIDNPPYNFTTLGGSPQRAKPRLFCRLGRDEHSHASAFHFGRLIHDANLGAGIPEPVQQSSSQLGMGHFPAAEADRNLDLIAALQKAYRLVNLGLKVMRIDIHRHPDFLDLHCFLVLSRFFFPFGLLIAVLAVIHDPADVGRSLGGDIHKVQALFNRQSERLPGWHNAQLVAVSINDADFLFTDFLVNQHLFFANGETPP